MAGMSLAQGTGLPRRAHYVLSPAESRVSLSLFVGGADSPLSGTLHLYLGDPSVPVVALAGMVGVSVDRADWVATDFEPDLFVLPEPMNIVLDPDHRSIGAWNTLTGHISLELYLIAPEGNLPVPMPVRVAGMLTNSGLRLSGDNGNVADGQLELTLAAHELSLPPSPMDIWFSPHDVTSPAQEVAATDHPGEIHRRSDRGGAEPGAR